MEELKSRIRPSDLIGRYVKLTRAGREFKGLSPFTTEKTPSFFVNDQKSSFFCFSSGQSGDVIKFLELHKGLSFVEAVEELAEAAGMEMPRQSPQEREREQRQATLIEVMEMASDFYQRTLGQRAGEGARAYLNDRALQAQTQETFRLGFAPAERTALHDHLLQREIRPDQMAEAGLIIVPDDGRPAYDRFRNRIMFPIEDPQGRVIAFGGRTLDPNVPAKYLNSPDTPLFHKGSVLYNLKRAREAAYRGEGPLGQSVIVAEGYMDVIALAQAGFEASVAPLGTALTERQIGLLWRLCPEPILSFDGDRAGVSAAYRVVDRALPLLKPGHSLRFALLPQGQDPDDLIRSGGMSAMRTVLEEAQPLANMLWDRELAVAPYDTPERRAGLEARLRSVLKDIQDGQIRDYYEKDFRNRINNLFRAQEAGPGTNRRRRGSRGPTRAPFPKGATAETKRSAVVRSQQGQSLVPEKLIVLTVLNHPGLLESHLDEFAKADLGNRKLDTLRNEIIRVAACGEALDRATLDNHLEGTDSAHVANDLRLQKSLESEPFARVEAEFQDVEKGWAHLLHLHESYNALQRELEEAEQALARDMTDENWTRLVAVKAQLHESKQSLADFSDGTGAI